MRLSDVKLGRACCGTALNKTAVQTIAVTSGKGGVGKTNVAMNLALALAKAGHKTLLLDADLGMANIDELLGMEASVNLLDVLEGKCSLEEIIIEGPEKLLIIPAASGSKYLSELGAVECGGLVHAFSELKGRIDSLVIDTSGGISESVTSFCRASSKVLVVTDNEPASIRDCVAQIRHLNKTNAIAHFHVLANMVLTARDGSELFKRILHLLGDDQNIVISYAGFVPHDELLRKAVFRRKAVISAYPEARSAIAIRNLARRMIRWRRPDTPHGQLEFFVERILQHNCVEREVLS
jgi:flagellar biosynthesis protein FlhG